jgi:hypothetical protein
MPCAWRQLGANNNGISRIIVLVLLLVVLEEHLGCRTRASQQKTGLALSSILVPQLKQNLEDEDNEEYEGETPKSDFGLTRS